MKLISMLKNKTSLTPINLKKIYENIPIHSEVMSLFVLYESIVNIAKRATKEKNKKLISICENFLCKKIPIKVPSIQYEWQRIII